MEQRYEERRSIQRRELENEDEGAFVRIVPPGRERRSGADRRRG